MNGINPSQIKQSDTIVKKDNASSDKKITQEPGDAFIKSDETPQEEPKVYFFSKRMISESAEQTLVNLGEWISDNP